MRKTISELCNIGEKSYYVWKNKSHTKLIALLEKYFSEEELQEFIETGKIEKLEGNTPVSIDDFRSLEKRVSLIEKQLEQEK